MAHADIESAIRAQIEAGRCAELTCDREPAGGSLWCGFHQSAVRTVAERLAREGREERPVRRPTAAPRPLRVLLVEDDHHKARAIKRLLTATARQAKVEIEVRRIETLADMPLRDRDVSPENFDAVVTDWSFPIRRGGGIAHNAGAAVVSYAETRGLPVVVVSGSCRPDRWRDTPARRWSESWLDDLTWLVDVVLLERLARVRPGAAASADAGAA